MIHALVGLLAAAVMAVPTGTDVDYQLGGAVEPPANVGIVVRDRTDPPVAGRFNVCYVNGFQTQPNEKRFWAKHPALVLRDTDGRPVVDEAWGEFLLDVRTAAKRKALARIVGRWVRGCAHDGYAAVEYDNLDSFTRSDGLLTEAAGDPVRQAARRPGTPHGLAAGQKNLAGFDGTTIGYDFAVSEECGRYDECQRYVDDFGDQVLMIEYRAEDFAETCRRTAPPTPWCCATWTSRPPACTGGADVLHATELGESGSRVVFCHGLFGQGRNFTAIGKALADRAPGGAGRHARPRPVAVERPLRLPRGRRPGRRAPRWSADDPVALVGHSMGGKISMLVALRHPELVERLVVVDVAPVPYDHAAEFERYIAAMRAIDLDTLERRREADAALLDAVPDPTVRGFLLQSLRREDDDWRWQLNLELLGRDLDAITDWPEDALAGTAPYDGPVLWVGGERLDLHR